jgi:DNA-binding response OmpR family regulator
VTNRTRLESGGLDRKRVASEPAPQQGPDSALLDQLRQLSVLVVVEDCGTSRENLVEFLTGWSMAPEWAADGATALAKFRQAVLQRRPFGLLIVDATLPDQEGPALVRQLRKTFRRVGPTILMVPVLATQPGQRSDRPLRNAVRLQKPITRGDLLQAIGRAVSERPPRTRGGRTDSCNASSSPAPAAAFDLADALEGVDGRYDRLQRMVEFYFGEAPLLLAQMRTGVQSRDASAIARAAHRLAGTLVYLRAQPALAAARRVDDLGGSGDLQGAAEAIPLLERELAQLEQSLIPHRA